MVCTMQAVGGAATITIVPGAGFSDPTPATSVGGNTGTTIGQQRLIAFQKGAEIWGNALESSVEILVDASFAPLFCNASSATLGSAGPISVVRDFSGALFSKTWYHVALANKLAGSDLVTGSSDISAQFNSDIDNNNGCLSGTNWYYGLDHNQGGDIDFLAVVLHEIGHGLGFSEFVNLTPGSLFFRHPDIFTQFLLDNSTGEHWADMTNSERQASSLNCGRVVWDGTQVATDAPSFLNLGMPRLAVNSPAAIQDYYQVGQAFSTSTPLSSPGVTANVELVNDGAATVTDGCQALLGFTLGNIALMDKNSSACTTTTQVANAATTGASGALIVDDDSGCPPPNFTAFGATIPAAMISEDTGNLIKGQIPSPGVNATLGLDSARLVGADPSGRVQVYVPDPVSGGSSISHFDTSVTPSVLMEPFITSNLAGLDLTPSLMLDIGWMLAMQADLSVSKVDNLDPVVAGNQLTYTITVTNAGPDDALDVLVTDTLPAGVTFDSTSGCANDPGGVPTCNLGTVLSGTSVDYTITVNVDLLTAGIITNSVSVVSNTTEANPGDESASEDTLVNSPPMADLSLTKVDDIDPVVAGGPLSYTVTVSNAGPDGATNVVVSDTLPAGVTFVSTTGCTNDPTGVPTCTLGNIAASGMASYTITVTVDAGTTGTITNNASVSSDTADPDTANSAVMELTTVNAPDKAGVFRNGVWVLDFNGNGVWDGLGTDRAVILGTAGDVAVVGDWNNDGFDAVGVFRNGLWVLDFNGNGVWDGLGTDRAIILGTTGDVPVVGDWNNTGSDKAGVFRNGLWLLDFNGNGVWDGLGTDRAVSLGTASDVPVVGDWDNTGSDKVGVFRNGVWVLDFNGNGVWDGLGTDRAVILGTAGDVPVVGDWDNSGSDKVGVFRNGVWVLDFNGNGVWDGLGTDRAIILGTTGDVPVVGDWNNTGSDKAGVFRNGLWLLDFNGNGVWDGLGTDRAVSLGTTGDVPVVGKWGP